MAPPKSRKHSAPTGSSPMRSQAHQEEQPFNKDGTRRKSRVLRRKTDHSIIERRRREKINEKLVALQNIVPACRKECQDLIDRKFVSPPQEREADIDPGSPNNKRNVKRQREQERVAKARSEMSEKIGTRMVLEKLCIISHTLEFVVKLQEENKELRALCDCQPERRVLSNSDVELDEHYRKLHGHDESGDLQSHVLDQSRATNKKRSSSLAFSDQGGLLQEDMPRPAKRRLHWGSDDVREAAVRNGFCGLRCTPTKAQTSQEELSSRTAQSPSAFDLGLVHHLPTAAATGHDGLSLVHAPLKYRPTAQTWSCGSFCRTKHSCCREQEQSSKASSDVSDELESPPPCPVKWPAITATAQPTHVRRPRLPSIGNLDLLNTETPLPSLRQDAIASLYRRDPPKASYTSEPKAFQPLSLYTSQASVRH